MKSKILGSKVFFLAPICAAIVACGGGSGSGSGPQAPSNNLGSVLIDGDTFSGATLSTSITDTDGISGSTFAYTWSADGTVIAGEINSSLALTDTLVGSEISVSVTYTDDAGFDETVESTLADTITPTLTVSATFIKGVVSGGSCSIFAISAAGVIATESLAAADTNSSGVADFSDIHYDGAALVTCTGGTYTDEATGDSRTAPTIRAVIDISTNPNPVITPLTEIAVQKAEAESDANVGILTALTTHNTDNSLGIDATAVVPTDLQSNAAANDEEGQYATLLALISQLASEEGADTAEELSELIEAFANEEITDQEISDAADALASSDSAAAGNISSAILDAVVDDLDLNLAVNSDGSVSISGNAIVGETLTASVSDSNGILTSSIAYQWMRGGVDIADANGSSYSPLAADVGNTLSVSVTYTDDEGFDEDFESSPTSTVTDSATVPVIGGNFDRGTIGDDDSVPAIICDTVFTSAGALEGALTREMTAGTSLCLANGEYNSLELDFGGAGTADSPITVAAQTSGGVTVTGSSSIRMTGSYAVVQGFMFIGGESASSDFLQTRAGDVPCNNCRVTEITVINLDDADSDSGRWLQLYGTRNRVDHSWFSGKRTAAPLLQVNRDIPEGGTVDDVPENFHRIDHNYFGNRPPADGKAYATGDDNGFEGIQIGTSFAHDANSSTVVAHNYFEQIEGEAEVISNKSSNNTIFNNTVRDSYGSITNRHGNTTTIANNFVIGDGHPFSGGLRIVDDGHRVINNYVEGARFLNTNFHGGIVLHNSGGSERNGYQVLENVLVANNTVTDSVNSLNFAGGRESQNPTDVRFVNNIVDDAVGPIIRSADEGLPEQSVYGGNFVEGPEFSDDDGLTSFTGFTQTTIDLEDDNLGIARPPLSSAALLAADTVVDISPFLPVDDDMDGQLRSAASTSGSDEDSADAIVYGIINANDVGPIGYRPPVTEPFVARIPIANAGFDEGSSGWTFSSPAEVTTDADEVFARGASGIISGTSGRIAQTLSVNANTNYALTAFTEGPIVLGADINGTEVTGGFNNSSYRFSQFEFNSGDATTVTIFAGLDGTVESNVDIEEASFDDFDSSASDENPWVIVEGNDSIGQVQRSSNSASGPDGSARFRYNNINETGSPMMSQFLDDIQANTDYELSVFVRADDGITATMGLYEGSTTTELASKLIDFDVLDADDSDAEEGDDGFRQDTLSFNSGSNTSLTLFFTYTANTNIADGGAADGGDTDFRFDDIEITFEGAPNDGDNALVDELRLVSFPGE